MEGGNKCGISGVHYLMSFHIFSKDIPLWVWATFEHKDNPGRCDYTGCNDSFGFSKTVEGGAGNRQKSNYTVPHQVSDHLADSNMVLHSDLRYGAGEKSEDLQELFRYFDIATDGAGKSGLHPKESDFAWQNYRLKGSQVDFTDHQGRATHLGNSITEAGFMSQSSCVGCHSRAGVAMKISKETDAGLLFQGGGDTFLVSESADFFHLGVFEPALSEFGYEQSHEGTPVHDWFYDDNSDFELQVLQTDFVWGFLNAKPLSSAN